MIIGRRFHKKKHIKTVIHKNNTTKLIMYLSITDYKHYQYRLNLFESMFCNRKLDKDKIGYRRYGSSDIYDIVGESWWEYYR